MSTMWQEDLDVGAGEYDDSDLYESGDEGEGLEWDESDEGGDEESWASRRRRARARRIALARRRQALIRARAQARGAALRRPAPVPAPPTSTRSTAAAIREVDLESKVAEDSLRRELGGMRRRMNRSEYAAVAGLAVNQFIESFNQPENEYARAALRFAPLLLLAPQRRGRGFESFVYDPRVMGGAAVLGITFLGQQRSRAAIVVAARSELPAGGPATQFSAQVLSSRGEALAGRVIRWESTDPSVATVDANGNVTPIKTGAVFIVVSAEGMPTQRVPLVVT